MSDLALLARWGDDTAEGLAPATRMQRDGVLLRFASWLAAHDRELLTVDAATIERWLEACGPVASRTRTNYLGALRAFYEWAIGDGCYRAANPTGPLRRWPTVDPLGAGVQGLWERWRLDMERRGLARSTMEKRRNELRLLGYTFMDPRSPLEATTDDLERYLDGRKLAPKARHTTVGHLRAFFAWAKREGLVDDDPAVELVRPKLPRALPRPIATAVLADALDQADPRMRAFLALAAFAGMRCQEIAGVAREDVLDHLDPPMILVANGKGARERMVPLHATLADALDRLPMPRAGYLFADRRGRPPTAEHVSQGVNNYLHDVVGTTATAHTLRHWFASQLYAQTRDLRLVQETLGHASPTTTAIYAAFHPGAAVDAVRALNLG